MTREATIPLLALHGFSMTPAMWDGVAASVDDTIPTFLRPALCGHGEAPPPVSSGEHPFSDEVLRLWGKVDAAGLSTIRLLGYSLGGRVALHMALAQPERVSKLVLVGTHPGLEESEERAARQRADQRWVAMLRGEGLAAFAAAWEQQGVLSLGQSEAATIARAMRLCHQPGALADAMEALGLGVMPSTWHRLDELNCPVTWVVGAKDRKFQTVAREACAYCRRGQLAVVPGAGHNVALEQPGQLATLLGASGL